MYSLDFSGLCSHNKLNVWITALFVFVGLHACVEVIILVDPDQFVDFTDMITDVWVCMFVFGVYPLVLAVTSTLMLAHSLLFDPAYPVMCVWHRNSIINLIQSITFSCLIIDFFCRYLDYQDDIQNTKNILIIFRPFFGLCLLTLLMVSLRFLISFYR